jgi:hypothetical protein
LRTLPLTVVAWIKTTSSRPAGIVNKYVSSSYNGYQIFLQYGRFKAWYLTPSGGVRMDDNASDGGAVSDGIWHQLVFVVNTSNGKVYVDTVLKNTKGWYGTPGVSTELTHLRLGNYSGSYFNGLIANVQIYNTALTPQEIQYLYQQGLGGGPVRLQNLVGWWPLNGDANDYSGNNNHGTIYNVNFVQNYNPP